MAESVKVIDPNTGSGYDYDSLFDWEAAQQADIDTSNTIAVAKCRCTGGTADTTAVVIDGWTTSATDYIKIWTDTSESYRHSGKWETGNKYRLSLAKTDGALVSVYEPYTRVIGIQTNNTGTYGSAFGIELVVGSSGSIIDSCIFYQGIEGIFVDSESYIVNCIAVDCSTTGFDFTPSGACFAYNCTAIDCGYGFLCSYGSATIKNCLGHSNTTADFFYEGSGTFTVTYCASSDLTADDRGGAGNRISRAFTFVDEAGNDFHLASNDAGALGFGLNLYNDATYPFQTDIDGDDRGGAAASWDIGADESVSATSIEQEGFRFRNDDGSETTATWKANQDTNITAPKNVNTRLRFVVNSTGDFSATQFQLEYRKSGESTWRKVTI